MPTIMHLKGAPATEIDQRLQALDAEWDVEQLLQTNAPVIVILGLALATTVSRKFLLLPTAVFGFFAQHALQGLVPSYPGVPPPRSPHSARNRARAQRPQGAAGRGDFDQMPLNDTVSTSERVRAALAAVDK